MLKLTLHGNILLRDLSPAKLPRFVALMAGANRMLARPNIPKTPLSVSIVRQLIDRLCPSQSMAANQYSASGGSKVHCTDHTFSYNFKFHFNVI